MKYKMILSVALLLAGQSALSSGAINDPGLVSLVTSLGPSVLTQATSGSSNDVLFVKQDAVIAKETGVISEALASVMEKMQTVDSAFLGMSDEQLIEVIILTDF